MGGNTYNRKNFSNDELQQLILKIDKYRSLFDDRVFLSEKAWRANISRHLDADSANRFFFMIKQAEGPNKCKGCSAVLTIESFSYAGEYKGFRKYCPNCIKNYTWARRENYTPEELKLRGHAISERKIKFYLTEKGKQTAKSNGRKISNALKEFHKTPAGANARYKSSKINAVIMKKKILSGELTPKSNNRNTHWNSEFGGIKYRSSWEALYQYFNPTALYESLRILYNYQNKERVYVVDFVDHINKVVTEVKPKELLKDECTQAKLAALREWADINKYEVCIFNMDVIKSLPEPDYTLFDKPTIKKLKRIYETFKN